MGQIIKFPVRAAKFGNKRVPRRCRSKENPAQLQLFSQATAQILHLAAEFSPFEYALLLDERGESGASEAYLKAVAEQDCIADAYCNLGVIESKQGRVTKAFDCFTTCLKHEPRHFEAHFNLGNMYFEVNDLRLAQVHYELAVEVDPTFPNVYFNLALVLSINNEFAAAIAALIRYQELAPGDEGRNADDLLENLKKSLATSKSSRAGVPSQH
jgi:tetratricopeptide (TPR) repeat protein